MVPVLVYEEGHDGGDDLAADSGQRRAGDAHLREAEIAEDQNGVEYDVEYGADELGYHRERGAAGGLEDALIGYLGKHAEGEDEHYAQV